VNPIFWSQEPIFWPVPDNQVCFGAGGGQSTSNKPAERIDPTRGFLILLARLTAREHTRIFLLCHYFVTPTNYEENESLLRGKKRMAAHDSYYRGRTEASNTKIGLSFGTLIGCCFCIVWQATRLRGACWLDWYGSLEWSLAELRRRRIQFNLPL